MVLIGKRLGRTVLVGTLILLLHGCVKDEATAVVQPVKGRVFIGGKPFEGLSVALYSVALRTATATGLTASGSTGADGEFTPVPNIKGGDIPPGEYIVTILYEPPPTEVIDALEGRGAPKQAPWIDRSYTNAAKSPLRVQIPTTNPGEVFEIPTIQLP